MARDALVRAAFRDQAVYCERLGSPLTARLCAALAEMLDDSTPLGARVLRWPGNPDATADGVPLRLCGGLHALVRAGEAPELAEIYPPNPPPEAAALRSGLAALLAARSDALLPWLDKAPQTNEVGRSAVLMAGLLAAAERFGLPIDLYELGASAGLNLLLDLYGYDLGGRRAGDARSPLQFAPEWEGPAPPDGPVRIGSRRGVDLHPVDPAGERERLIAYVWPDQPRRLRQIATALEIAAAQRPPVDRDDAARWLERRLPIEPAPGRIRVVLHSVAFQYFPPGTQRRVAARVGAAGAAARPDAPVAWLRFEKLPEDPNYSLRLRTWPGEDRLLAWAQPHGARIKWLGR